MSTEPINLADRIELRRFVGREFLLWLWLETELFDATMSTKEHGEFGLWVEGRLVLDLDRESTTIRGTAPGRHREAKEALLRGKTPERAGLHLSFGDHECTLVLRGDSLAIGGLVPPRKEKEPTAAIDVLAERRPPRGAKKKRRGGDEGDGDDLAHDSFYDRMHFARDVEALTTALYRDFLALRLSPTWEKTVVPALEAWVAGEDVDAERYRAARSRVVSGRTGR